MAHKRNVFEAACREAFSDVGITGGQMGALLPQLWGAFREGVADCGLSKAKSITGLHRDILKPALNRTWRLTYGRLQWERIVEAAESFPYLMLDVTEMQRARPECVAMDGKARRWDDPYWKTGFPPCERKNCLCRVIQMGQRQIDRGNVEVLKY